MKIGIIGLAYNCAEDLDKVLLPWFEYKRLYNNIFLSITHTCFKERFHKPEDVLSVDGTEKVLIDLNKSAQLDYVYISDGPLTESEARNKCLEPLLKHDLDLIWILDCQDEFYTVEYIKNIIDFVENNEFTDWFKIHLQNFVHDKNHYIEGFAPPRLFRINYQNYQLGGFYGDNDVFYNFNGNTISYQQLSYLEIPKKIAFIPHYTWLSNEKSKQKILYHNSRWSTEKVASLNGDGCSYKWNQDDNKVEFCEKYYKKFNATFPQIKEIF